MRNEQAKHATIDAVNLMILHADKGPSGFWVDDYEGCGNPLIFPEFEEGLKQGRLVHKEHYFCPWNTAIMRGSGHGNISTGCYHSCSIDKARYLSAEELKKILVRFKVRLENGDYDYVNNLAPLLTEGEIKHIEDRILAKRQECERYEERIRQERLAKASALIAKYPDESSFLLAHYGEDICIDRGSGPIFFDPDSRKDVIGAEGMSYNEYLDIQFASLGHTQRSGFSRNILLDFQGQIEKVNSKHVCFKRICFSGMHVDGVMFDAKEDHVWMDKSGFEEYKVGDNVSFEAEVYRYVKTGNGKLIDYGLRNPTDIRKIETYNLPSDDALMMQEIEQLICETCFLSCQCDRNYCTIPPEKRDFLKHDMFQAIKTQADKEVQK